MLCSYGITRLRIVISTAEAVALYRGRSTSPRLADRQRSARPEVTTIMSASPTEVDHFL